MKDRDTAPYWDSGLYIEPETQKIVGRVTSATIPDALDADGNHTNKTVWPAMFETRPIGMFADLAHAKYAVERAWDVFARHAAQTMGTDPLVRMQ